MHLRFHFYTNMGKNDLIVWGSTAKPYLDPLTNKTRKKERIITFSSHEAHIPYLFNQMIILPLASLYDSLVDIFMFKVYHSYHPSVLKY